MIKHPKGKDKKKKPAAQYYYIPYIGEVERDKFMKGKNFGKFVAGAGVGIGVGLTLYKKYKDYRDFYKKYKVSTRRIRDVRKDLKTLKSSFRTLSKEEFILEIERIAKEMQQISEFSDERKMLTLSSLASE